MIDIYSKEASALLIYDKILSLCTKISFEDMDTISPILNEHLDKSDMSKEAILAIMTFIKIVKDE